MAKSDVSKNNANHKHSHKKGTWKFTLIFTPLLVLIMCCAVVTLAGYKDFQTLKSYAHFAFNDSLRTDKIYKDNEYRVSDADDKEGTVKDTDDKDKEHKIVFPYFGDVYARLTIDNKAADIKNVPVIWGSSDKLLDKGACQANYSTYIGNQGRVVISGHNHKHFKGLPKVKIGDKVTLKTKYGKFVYRVKGTRVLNEKDTSLLYYDPTAEPPIDDLMLYTCWNNGYMGMSDERLYIICEVVSKEFKD